MRKKTTRRKGVLPGKDEGNRFDKILKENIEATAPAMFRVIMKLNPIRTENLPAMKIQTTTEVEPDFGKVVHTEEPPPVRVVLLEFEAKDEAGTDTDMALKVLLALKKYRLPIDLRMIYLLEGKPKHITGKVNNFGLSFEYPIYCISDYSYTEFLNSENPEDVVIAILAKREDLSGEQLIDLILQRLRALLGKKRRCTSL